MNTNAINACASMITRLNDERMSCFMNAFAELLAALDLDVVYNAAYGIDQRYNKATAVGAIGELIAMCSKPDSDSKISKIRIRNQIEAIMVHLDLPSACR